ncbi:MAG: hypothetical protein M5U34_34930 [Chloroflexi bacterium]|nr:hypothetical protein [Chloroflexota bacterium]
MRTLPYLLKTELCLEKAEEWHGAFTFTDVGAIVYYLKAIPWLVSGFSVNTHLSHLLALQEKVENGEALRFRAQLYLLQARKPKDRIYA